MKPFVMKGIKKIPWRVTLPDETSLTLQPLKLGSMTKLLNADDDFLSQTEAVAEMLSSNLEGKTYSSHDVIELFDIADMQEFIKKYFEYIQEFTGQKN